VQAVDQVAELEVEASAVFEVAPEAVATLPTAGGYCAGDVAGERGNRAGGDGGACAHP
jgi:hypothetical protein